MTKKQHREIRDACASFFNGETPFESLYAVVTGGVKPCHFCREHGNCSCVVNQIVMLNRGVRELGTRVGKMQEQFDNFRFDDNQGMK